MAFDQHLAQRIRDVLSEESGVTEKRMFGGLAFLLDGRLALAAGNHGGLLLRNDPADVETHVSHAHVSRFEMRGRPMDGWLHVDDAAVDDEDGLRRWVAVGVTYARSLGPRD